MDTHNNPPIKVFIIEKNHFIRDGFELILDSEPDFKIVGSFSNFEESFSSIEIAKAEIILIDIKLSCKSGIKNILYLKKNFPSILIVICVESEDDKEILQTIKAGAIGYISKKTNSRELLSTLRIIFSGGSPMTSTLAAIISSSFKKENFIRKRNLFTDTEQKVIERISYGKSYSTVAKELSLSEEEILRIIRIVYLKLQKQKSVLNKILNKNF